MFGCDKYIFTIFIIYYHISDFDFIELSQLSAQFNMYGKLFLDKE